MKPVVWVLWLGALVACSSEQPAAPVNRVDSTDPAMVAAIAEARASVDEFLAALEKRSPGMSSFSVKIPLQDGETVEHLWLVELSHSGTTFSGVIGNDPQKITTVKGGDEHQCDQSEISDWMYLHSGKMVGNRTLRAQFANMPPEQVKQLKKQFGWE